MRFHGIYQHDVRDCGVACLATICEYYGLKVPLSYIRDLEKVNMNGSSIYGICEAAKILGLDAEAYQGSIQELLEEVNDTKEICTPFIVHTVKDGLFHFVVVKKINSHFVWIFDPDKGNLKMKIESFTEIWTGYIISFQITSQFRNGNLKKGTYERYVSLLRNHKKEFIWLFLLSLLITGITVMCTLIFQHIVDHFMVHSNTELMRMVNVVFAIIIVLYIIRLGIYIIRGIVGARISRDIEKKLLDDFLGDLLKVSVNYYDSRTNGEVLERLNDIEHIKETLCSTVLNLTLDLVTALVSGIIIFIKSPVLFVITCVIMLVYIIEVLCFKKVFYSSNRAIAQNHGDMLAMFKETIDGFTTIRTFAAEKFIEQEDGKKIKKLVHSNYKNEKILLLNVGISLSIESIGIIVLFWCGFFFVLKENITIGGLLVVILLAQNMISPTRDIIEAQNKIHKFMVSIERLNDICYSSKNVSVKNRKNMERSDDYQIKVENLSFAYGYSENALKNINMRIRKGRKIAFIGKSGSGKTTLVNLFMGMRYPDTGKIYIDGEDIQSITPDVLHRKVAYVQQDIFLFSKSILDNLCMGRNEITDEQLEKIIHDCQLEEIIHRKEDGLYTVLSENAHNLSAGEKQRIGIARALLQRPEIIIFDEVTSNLDVITEKEIVDMIYKNCKDITCIFVAHRLQTIHECDEIYVFDGGEIVESGTTQELIAKENVYFQMLKNVER